MTVSETLDLSECLLCGRPLSGDGVLRSYGGFESEVHPGCAEDGLEGKDLDSPHGDPDGTGSPADGPSEADEGEGAREPDDARTPAASADSVDDEGAGEAATEAASAGAASGEDGGDAGSETRREAKAGGSGGGDPDWTRISDFT